MALSPNEMDDKKRMYEQSRGNIVVTGVSTGIGRAIAEDLIAEGYRVFGSVRRVSDAESLVTQYGSKFVTLVFDVTDPTELEEAVEFVTRELRGSILTALVNNAGISLSGPLLHQPVAEFRKTFEVNVFAVLDVTRAFLPLLGMGDGEGERPGRIINIGSVAGAMTTPFMAAYSASKHALEALSQGLRRELIPYGIEVSTIEPSFIRTAIFEKAAATGKDNSYQGTRYEASWSQFNHSLLKQEAQAALPIRVTRAVRHAIESRTPRTRYPLDNVWYLGRILPDRFFDLLIFKALGISKSMRRTQ